MSDNIRSVSVRVPITINVGPIPADLVSHSQIFTFGLANIKGILNGRGIVGELDGERALAGYVSDGGLATYTALGAKLDDRHFRVQPAEGGHSLETSVDGGKTFVEIAVLQDFDLANAFGSAWVDGRVEKSA